jgi:phosphate-selective porin
MPRCRSQLSVALAFGAAVSRAALGQAPAPSPVTLIGALQVRETYQSGGGLTATINRARLGASSRPRPGLTWRIQGEFRTGSVGTGRASVSLLEAYVRYASGPWALQGGQYKVPFSSQYLTTFSDVETADRAAVVDALAPKRDIGVMAQYAYRQLATLTAGVFNGEGQNVTTNADSTVLGAGRLVLRPVRRIVLGANVARYFGDSTRYGVDAGYEGPALTLRAEYLAQTRDGQALPRDRGWYAVAAYFLVPSVQVVSQYETFSRPGIVAFPRNRAWTAGAHWFPINRDFRLTAEYISRSLGDPGARTGALLSQVQLRF